MHDSLVVVVPMPLYSLFLLTVGLQILDLLGQTQPFFQEANCLQCKQAIEYLQQLLQGMTWENPMNFVLRKQKSSCILLESLSCASLFRNQTKFPAICAVSICAFVSNWKGFVNILDDMVAVLAMKYSGLLLVQHLLIATAQTLHVLYQIEICFFPFRHMNAISVASWDLQTVVLSAELGLSIVFCLFECILRCRLFFAIYFKIAIIREKGKVRGQTFLLLSTSTNIISILEVRVVLCQDFSNDQKLLSVSRI